MLSATPYDTITDTMLPAIASDRRMSRRLAQLVFVRSSPMLLAASAQFKVMVAPSPVPITGQTLVVLMIGMEKALLFGIQNYLWGDEMKLIVAACLMLAAVRGVIAFERMSSNG